MGAMLRGWYQIAPTRLRDSHDLHHHSRDVATTNLPFGNTDNFARIDAFRSDATESPHYTH